MNRVVLQSDVFSQEKKIPESRKEDSSIIVCDTVTTEDIDKRLEELQEKKNA